MPPEHYPPRLLSPDPDVIAALAFVPLDKVVEYFEQLQQHFGDAVTPVLDYFKDNSIRRPLHNAWSETAHLCAQFVEHVRKN